MPTPRCPCDDFTSATEVLMGTSPAASIAAYAILREGLASPAAHLPDDFWMLARVLLDGAEDLVPESLWRHLPFLLAHAIAHPMLREASLVRRWLRGATGTHANDHSWDPASLAGLARAALLLDLPLVRDALGAATTPAGHAFQRALATAPELPTAPRVAAALAAVGNAETLAALAPHRGLDPVTHHTILRRLSALAPREALPFVTASARATGQVAPDVLTALLGAADTTVRALVLLDLLPWLTPTPATAGRPHPIVSRAPLIG